MADDPRVELCLRVLEKFLGEPYIWGGDDPEGGFDCSGLVIEGLKSTGALPRSGDWTAELLYQRWRATGILTEAQRTALRPGHLLFWGGDNGKTHVEMVYAVWGAGFAVTIGASGGGSKTLSKADAIAQNAYVKIRPAVPGWVAVWPF